MPAKTESLIVPDFSGAGKSLSASDYEQLANDTLADIREYEAKTRLAAVPMIRNGARILMVREMLGKKAASSFIKFMAQRGASKTTLYDHEAAAELVFKKIGWLDKAGKIVAAPKLQLLYSVPFDLFTDEATQLREDAIGDVMRLIGKQSIREVVKTLSIEGTEPKGVTLIGGHQSPGADHSDEAKREREIKAAAEMANDIQQWLATDGCFAIDAKAGRRLLVAEAGEQGLDFTIGLLSDEHLAALKTAFGHGLECIEHHERHRNGGVKVQRKGKQS